MQLGIDRLLQDKQLQSQLSGKRLALAAHPASVTQSLQHSLDALCGINTLQLCAAFGPQHGMRGDKQDNMIESPDYQDPIHRIPVFSLYGEVRRPTAAMMDSCDVVLFDIQDLGCRIYTYITTLLYMLEACQEHGKSLWVLDRPNPAGRPVEGSLLLEGWESFVGAGQVIMRHGLTMGEMARWFVKHHRLNVDLHIISMQDYDPTLAPGYGWPSGELCWVNPSPNASSLNMARFYAGSVLIEGTTLSEGRGTTVPLEIMGAPDIDILAVLTEMQQRAPQWLQGVKIRPCYFEPTFHKHKGTLCQGFQVHTDYHGYQHQQFFPFRLTLVFLQAIKALYPDYDLWSRHAYEYEHERLPFDVINGGSFVREWIEDTQADAEDMDKRLRFDEAQWKDSIADLLLYP
ncbi:MAG: DUF1343 domain-containing protein [Gammaproteobacteria bacterium]|nr:DUF1343 domain-containing protein [Gammaproteobacteria bacterium]MDH5801403.1 DUF1343 domain-containing protein [Gammaproteobacteria bacterium]